MILDGHAVNPEDLSWKAVEAMGELKVFDLTAESDVVARACDADLVLTTRTPLSEQ